MDEYSLVNCDFHDRLEALATLRQTCKIIFRNQMNELAEVQDRIVDVYAANKDDFIKLQEGTEIRLDKIVSVDDVPISYCIN